MSDLVRRWRAPTLTFAAALVVWWAITGPLAQDGAVIERFEPVGGFTALWQMIADGDLWPHIVVSLRRLLLGLGFAVVIGVPLGATLGWWRGAERATEPLFRFVRMVSPLSWAPIAIIVFGIGDRPVYFLVAIGAVWPIALNTAAGVRGLDPGWLLVARSLGATRSELLRTVVAPGVKAHVFTGLRVALGIAWIILVPAEMLGVDSGLGYFVLDTRDRLAYDELVAAILTIGMLGSLLDVSLQYAAAASWKTPRPGRRRRNRTASEVGALGPVTARP